MGKTCLFVDVETTGKNFDKAVYRENKLLSISYLIVDEELNILNKNSFILHHDKNISEEMNDYVKQMHAKTGLLNEVVKSKLTLKEVENKILQDLEPYSNGKIIPAGNNIQFDVEVVRRNLPLVFEKFHYSFFDITSVRKALSLIYPSQIKKIKDAKKLNHNSLVDCEDALNELKAILDFVKNK